MIKFIHIPKTAGTALKNALKLSKTKKQDVAILGPHNRTLINTHTKNLGIVCRDPWQRFCSGFWEVKTLAERRKLALESKNKRFAVGQYAKLNKNELERTIMQECETPDDYVTWLRENEHKHQELFIHEKNYSAHIPLGLVTSSLVYWLGTHDTFKEHEHKVVLAVDQNNLTTVMETKFGLTMPTDSFAKRSRSQFQIAQPYTCSQDNMIWFKEWRHNDYELINYIKSRDYYV